MSKWVDCEPSCSIVPSSISCQDIICQRKEATKRRRTDRKMKRKELRSRNEKDRDPSSEEEETEGGGGDDDDKTIDHHRSSCPYCIRYSAWHALYLSTHATVLHKGEPSLKGRRHCIGSDRNAGFSAAKLTDQTGYAMRAAARMRGCLQARHPLNRVDLQRGHSDSEASRDGLSQVLRNNTGSAIRPFFTSSLITKCLAPL